MKKVLVIGGGPGGYVAAIRLAQLGAEATVVERDRLGGTCLNVGCIPTKCLLHSAELLEELKTRGGEIGVAADNVHVDFPKLMKHKDETSQKLSRGIGSLLQANKVAVIPGTARFLDAKTVEIAKADGTCEKRSFDAVILATGSYNAAPPIPGLKENPNCIDSTGALSLPEAPRALAVVGAGVIGLELACAYAAFGTSVTVVEALPEVLPNFDRDVVKVGDAHLKRMGVTIHVGAKVQRIEESAAGAKVVFVTASGAEQAVEADKVLVATGRRANTASLQLDKAGILEERGAILVNDRMETSVPGVYAIGDCVKGYPQLAHTASAMGEVAAENIMGVETHFDAKTNPACLYILPEAATVGLTEAQCKAQGIEYVVGKFPMAGNGKALIMNGGEGFVKILAGKEYGEILGMHAIGPRASDLIGEGALAIGTEATLDELVATIHSHPTVTEAVREAALGAMGRAIHMPNR